MSIWNKETLRNTTHSRSCLKSATHTRCVGACWQDVWGQSTWCHSFLFYLIDTDPREVKAITAHACRCLFAGQLIGLAFDPLAPAWRMVRGIRGIPHGRLLPPPPLTIICLSRLLLHVPHCLVSHKSSSSKKPREVQFYWVQRAPFSWKPHKWRTYKKVHLLRSPAAVCAGEGLRSHLSSEETLK